MDSLTNTFTMEELFSTTLRELVQASMAIDPSIDQPRINDVARRLSFWAEENKITKPQLVVALMSIFAAGTVEGMQLIKDRTGASQA